MKADLSNDERWHDLGDRTEALHAGYPSRIMDFHRSGETAERILYA